MWPSPSCGSPPKWRGARRKFSMIDLDDDGVAGLAGAVARGDDARRWAGPGTAAALAAWRVSSREPPPKTPARATSGGRRHGDCHEVAALLLHRSGNITRNIQILMRRAGPTIAGGSRSRSAPRRPGALGGRPGRPRRPLRRHPARARHLRRRPQLPRRDRCPSGWSSGAPTRPPATALAAATTTATTTSRGFSLTHLSGAGCALYGDFPFLPTTEPIDASPAGARRRASTASFQPGFSHAERGGRPGYYSVRLNPVARRRRSTPS